MVLRADIAAAALDAADAGLPRAAGRCSTSRRAAGRSTRRGARRSRPGAGVTLLCGRFEGIDERVLAGPRGRGGHLGDFVLTGGEIAAMALIDACVRLIPRVLGNSESPAEECSPPASWSTRTTPARPNGKV